MFLAGTKHGVENVNVASSTRTDQANVVDHLPGSAGFGRCVAIGVQLLQAPTGDQEALVHARQARQLHRRQVATDEEEGGGRQSRHTLEQLNKVSKTRLHSATVRGDEFGRLR